MAGLKLTRAEFVSRLTVASLTPDVERSARSTCDWQAAQDMPMTGSVMVQTSPSGTAAVVFPVVAVSIAGIAD